MCGVSRFGVLLWLVFTTECTEAACADTECTEDCFFILSVCGVSRFGVLLWLVFTTECTEAACADTECTEDCFFILSVCGVSRFGVLLWLVFTTECTEAVDLWAKKVAGALVLGRRPFCLGLCVYGYFRKEQGPLTQPPGQHMTSRKFPGSFPAA